MTGRKLLQSFPDLVLFWFYVSGRDSDMTLQSSNLLSLSVPIGYTAGAYGGIINYTVLSSEKKRNLHMRKLTLYLRMLHDLLQTRFVGLKL